MWLMPNSTHMLVLLGRNACSACVASAVSYCGDARWGLRRRCADGYKSGFLVALLPPNFFFESKNHFSDKKYFLNSKIDFFNATIEFLIQTITFLGPKLDS